MEITLPYKFTPRDYQLPFLKGMEKPGVDRALCVWHRRSGKDKTFLNYMIPRMVERPGSYYYFFPTYKQGRKVLWDARDGDGFRFLDHFPRELYDGEDGKKNDQEMKIVFKTSCGGSLFQIVGTDDFDSIMGTNPVGCVFSEFSLQNPKAWDFISPILRDNKGWGIFNGTPRGMNHEFNMWQQNKDNPDWYVDVITIEQSLHNGERVFTDEMLEKERRAGKTENFLRQEYYCDWMASSENRLISLDLINEAMNRSYHESEYINAPRILGVDIAEGEVEGDSHAMIKRQGLQAWDLVIRNDVDAMVWANQVSNEILKWRPDAVFVDGIGVGAPFVARLRQLGHENVTSVKSGVTASDDGYVNLRAEMADKCRMWLEEGGALPDNSRLKSDLTNLIRDYREAGNKMFLLPKKKVKVDYGFDSPDAADALMLTFAYPVSPSLRHGGGMGAAEADTQRAMNYDPLGRNRSAVGGGYG